MTLFISKKNQELLWRVINRNDIIKNMDINFKTDWFKQTVSYYYDKYEKDKLTKKDIIKINNDFIEHIKKDLKFMNEIRENKEIMNHIKKDIYINKATKNLERLDVVTNEELYEQIYQDVISVGEYPNVLKRNERSDRITKIRH